MGVLKIIEKLTFYFKGVKYSLSSVIDMENMREVSLRIYVYDTMCMCGGYREVGK